MWTIKTVELMIDYSTYAFLQWYYLIPNMMNHGTETDQWLSTFCLNGIKKHQGNGKRESIATT